MAPNRKQCHLLAKRWTILLHKRKFQVKLLRKRLHNSSLKKYVRNEDGISAQKLFNIKDAVLSPLL